MKKIIKLINNERTNPVISAKKADACDAQSTDTCYSLTADFGDCYNHSYDVCNKDYAGCHSESYDYCTNIDEDACGAFTNYDYN